MVVPASSGVQWQRCGPGSERGCSSSEKADRSRSALVSTATGLEQRGGADRRRAPTTPLRSGSGPWLDLRSRGGDEPREVLLRLGLRSRFSAGLWGFLRQDTTLQRRRVAARRAGWHRDARQRLGGAWWLCCVGGERWWSAALVSGAKWRLGRALVNGLAVVRRHRDATRRRCAPWRRSGAGAGLWLQAWWAAGLGPWVRWWLGRVFAFGRCWWFFISSCFISCCLFMVVALLKISPYSSGVGQVGLGACFCTLCALSALGRWRVPCIRKWSQPPRDSKMSALGRRRVPCVVKWSLPPSGRVKLSVTGCFVQWQHDGKAAHMDTMLSCNRGADLVIFPSCHRCVTYVKANRVAIRALFASWCLVEYSYLVETHDSMSGCSLDAHCNQGFWFFVPPLYSTVSLMKA